MPSHLSTLGFSVKTREDFSSLAMQTAQAGQRVRVPEQGSYSIWTPGGRVELWAQLNEQDELIGLHPHFNGEAVLQMILAKRISRPNDTALDGAFYAWAGAPENDPEAGEYPLVFDVPDYRVHDGLQLPKVAKLRLVAFAYEMKAYENEAVFRASGSRMAAEACIPSGLFRPQSQGGGLIDPPKSEAIYVGRVLEAARLTNPLTQLVFAWARIQTLGGEIDIVADPEVVKGTIVKDGIVSGVFWLSGRFK